MVIIRVRNSGIVALPSHAKCNVTHLLFLATQLHPEGEMIRPYQGPSSDVMQYLPSYVNWQRGEPWQQLKIFALHSSTIPKKHCKHTCGAHKSQHSHCASTATYTNTTQVRQQTQIGDVLGKFLSEVSNLILFASPVLRSVDAQSYFPNHDLFALPCLSTSLPRRPTFD